MVEHRIQKCHDQKPRQGQKQTLPECPAPAIQQRGIKDSPGIRYAQEYRMLIKHGK